MAIVKRVRKTGVRYQVKEKGSDGRWITATFDRLVDAEKKEAELRLKKRSGLSVTNNARHVSVSDYFPLWNEETKNNGVSAGWRAAQVQMYQAYVEPVIGREKLQGVTPIHISKVLGRVAELGRGESVRMHVYNLMHKMFEDAVELFELRERNPVLQKLRPKVVTKESRYLDLSQVRLLLKVIEGQKYETAILLQLFAGFRVGEV
jgi:hypothetical protein